MSSSVESLVGAATGLQNYAQLQDNQNVLLRKVLDNQSNTVMSLINSVPSAPQLASSGMVGTQLHVTA
ncbi:hypothetical protein [Castellaniella sp. MT123]|uniref:hypothetical protein n=1 Tax=Castellaniella sp. MT123 TaxID=3140381 RepID=UPI0031F40106